MTAPMTLDVILGLALDGPHITELDDLEDGASRVGTLVAGPAGLLRDLELRLGLTADETPPPVRVARYARRLEAVATAHRTPLFWSASFAKDPLGTARTLLGWRDELVLSGWNGQPIRNGGPRLEALSWVDSAVTTEAQPDLPPLPAGEVDRWAAVAAMLATGARVPYTRVRVVDPIALLPRRIRDVLGQLTAQGTKVAQVPIEPTPAPKDTDLGRLQQHLLTGGAPFSTKGDGSLLLLEAETATDLAGATVALLLGQDAGSRAAVLRLSDPGPLDYALRARGLATQGLASSSPLRPSFQVLPLVLELAYEPKDPHRVLELLTLPGGPFAGGLGRRLAAAFASRPGLGNSSWEEAKQAWAQSVLDAATDTEDEAGSDSVEARVASRLLRLEEWVEVPGATEPSAPRATLLEVVARVQKWLAGRAQHASLSDPEQAALAAQAHVQGATLISALAADPRARLTIVELRQLFAEVIGGGHVTQLPEQAGRIDHVSAPAALLRPRDTLVLWGAVDVGRTMPSSPWTPSERSALLADASMELPNRARLLAFEAEAARRALLLTTGKVIFARPLTQLREESAPHPLLDEVVARLGADRAALARVTVTARSLLAGEQAHPLPALPLPEARAAWSLGKGVIERRAHLSPSSIETLIGCPLRFVLEKEAGLRDASVVSLPDDPNLYGTIGHRLVEKLHLQALLGAGTAADPQRLRQRAEETLDVLLRQEATPLLVPGRGDDRAQFRALIIDSVLALDDLLRRGKLTVASVEETIEVDWEGRKLEGRLDLLLRDDRDRDVVLDLKWGATTYADKLKAGVAIQLATYAFVQRRRTKQKRLPEAAYYALRKAEGIALSGEVFPGARVIDGPDLELTWTRTLSSLAAVEEDLAAGRVAVPGVTGGRPAWSSPARAQANPKDFVPLETDAACGYCSLDAVCGKRWVGVAEDAR